MNSPLLKRRSFLQTLSVSLGGMLSQESYGDNRSRSIPGASTLLSRTQSPKIHTVLGPIDPAQLGATLMHEHAPLIDWSELHGTQAADYQPRKAEFLDTTERQLTAFHASLTRAQGPGAIVECTPIRVGRYPRLMVELANRGPVHIIACTGFWCEAFAPQHPWALRLAAKKDGVRQLAKLYVQEIEKGMEDPTGDWGERFTNIKVGIIKCATSTHLQASERSCHLAAARACVETGCPITTHTTNGGGLEEAELFLKQGVAPHKIIIGHQGHMDDRIQKNAHDYHRRIAELGCFVQFDRIGHENYEIKKMTSHIKHLIDHGFASQILLGHDHVPFLYEKYEQKDKPLKGWQGQDPDFTVITNQLVASLLGSGVNEKHIQQLMIGNPARALAF